MSSLVPIYLYHTNDLHSNLKQWPSAVSYIKKRREFHQVKEETALFFDIGDHADRVHPMTEATRGKGNVELLNEAGIQYVTIGNNEGITLSKEELDHLYEDASFKVLVANLFYKDESRRPDWAEPFDIIQTKEGVRIGMIGVTVAFYPFYKELGWDIKDPMEVLPALLEEVKQKSDIIILLSHLGYPQDEQVAETFEDIDVILGAHTHHLLKTSVLINNTLVAQCGKNSYYVGQVEIQFDLSSGSIVKKAGAAEEISHESPAVPTQQLLRELETKADSILEEPIASIPAALPVSWTEPSPFADLLAEGLREWCQADIAMLNSGLLLDSLESGEVTRKDLHRLCPHPINPCLVHVKGAVLKETISAAFTEKMIHLPLKGLGFRGEKLGRMAFSGITVEWEEGESHSPIVGVFIQGEPLDPDKTYALATVDMFTFGPLYPGLSQANMKKYFMPEMMRDVLLQTLKKRYT
ncbi:2',3'-cyclic-nucleotide 2'-phosphodiesterase/5'-or 3'-nucleotidase, 5'-nucleotidase family [Alteribacillus persepolensis]|uniref:2',3'-cyclic-nucleotide 2'-phosphodiesterase/5'-or 3'-nucleotidase, 5'-nucleotidase family n=1 Tax=Alteribacillus persepolensis TaxID=568899 RepID=A0A1G8DW13_9BACI|nr:bifunctional UDP-sugar hydrolase/5'-nucleotidase [Alteribacillus persepolensis]SDH61872.1 2',3'-cyclic-nucleotide 2'-phosphodiesterase/5'-or 3'-nucleotidase, 5'-nucleotidase family [Alteribacillus persepolensis]